NLAKRRTILRRDTDGMPAFLEYGRVVNDQHSVAAPDELICLNQQFSLHRGWIPDPSRDKMVQLIVTTGRNPLGHWRNALAVTRTDQPRHVDRAHPASPLIAQQIQKRL